MRKKIGQVRKIFNRLIMLPGLLTVSKISPSPSDAAAACLFAASTSSENELIRQRQADTRRTPVTRTATDKALPATAPVYRSCIKWKHRRPGALFLLGWWRLKVTSESTRSSPTVWIHTHVRGSLKDQHSPCQPGTPACIPAPLTSYDNPLL